MDLVSNAEKVDDGVTDCQGRLTTDIAIWRIEEVDTSLCLLVVIGRRKCELAMYLYVASEVARSRMGRDKPTIATTVWQVLSCTRVGTQPNQKVSAALRGWIGSEIVASEQISQGPVLTSNQLALLICIVDCRRRIFGNRQSQSRWCSALLNELLRWVGGSSVDAEGFVDSERA